MLFNVGIQLLKTFLMLSYTGFKIQEMEAQHEEQTKSAKVKQIALKSPGVNKGRTGYESYDCNRKNHK